MADAFPISGNIDPKAFPFLLMDLHRHGATGSLKVEGPSYQKALYFRGGRILFGSSNDPRDQLGAILIEDGKITPEQLEDVNTKVGPGNPLAKVLADSGFVSQRELGEAARAKVERILSDVMVYESGSFEFEDGVLPKGAVDLKLSTEKLVLSAVRRVGDRNFVLRHLGGLDVVLAPKADSTLAMAEIRGEAGGLVEQLDGHQTLKSAAALTRLDEFDAAKVACALLFLGALELAPSAAEATMIMTAPGDGELDLAGTARMAFDTDTPAASLEASSDPAFFIPDAEPPAGPSFTPEAPTFTPNKRATVTPPPPPETPLVIAEPEPEPEPQPEPESEPTLLIAPPAPMPPPQIEVEEDAPAPPPRASLPLQPPTRRPEPRPEPPAISMPATPSTRPPSKEDLAALDALLNSRSVEGPLTPLEKGGGVDRSYEPRFGQPRRAQRGSRLLPVLLGGAAVVVLGGAAAGGWYYMHRGAAPAHVAARTPPPPATTSPSTTLAAAPTTTEVAAPTTTLAAAPPTTLAAPPTTVPPPTTTLAARPTPAPKPTPAATRPSGGDALSQARALLQKSQFPDAARAFAQHLKTAPGTAWSVQILVACSDETVGKAVAAVAAPELFIIPVNFKGRDCYRLCWGLYETESRAGTAAQSVPEYFRKGGAHPKVVGTSSILP